jgi:hypothetical protein
MRVLILSVVGHNDTPYGAAAVAQHKLPQRELA